MKRKRNAKRRRPMVPAPSPVHFVRLRLPKVELAEGRRWFVVRSQPMMDTRVERELKALGAETYVPFLVEKRARRGRLVDHKALPAAGYVFAGTEAPETVSAFGRVDGALEVLAGAGGPSEVKREALQVFADILTRCNEEAREAEAKKPARARGLAELANLIYVAEPGSVR
jgi:hypothetical protein